LGSGSSGWGSSRQWVAAGDPCALQPFVKLFLSRTRVERVPRDHQWPHPGKGWSSWSKATSKLTKLALSGTKMCVLKALTSTVYRVSKGFKMSQISSARPFLVRTWEFSPRHLCRQPERSGFSNHTTSALCDMFNSFQFASATYLFILSPKSSEILVSKCAQEKTPRSSLRTGLFRWP
jgi:hypothetical protein